MMTPSAVSTANGRTAFVIGGSLLTASGVLGLLRPILPWTTWTFRLLNEDLYVLSLVHSALFAAALLVFAWGWRGEGSVVARRPFGVLALSLFGVWNLMMLSLVPFMRAVSDAGGYEALLALTLLQVLAPIIGVVAVVSIARARAVPGAWRWVPAIALCPYLVLVVLNVVDFAGAFFDLMDVPVEGFSWVIPAEQLLLGVMAVGLAISAGRPARGQQDEQAPASAAYPDEAPEPAA